MATAPRRHYRRLSRLILAAACAIAAGCGGQGGASQTEQIETAVKRVMESESVKDQCETGVSERFVREVYGTLVQCREANTGQAGDPAPDTARVSATRIDGDRATTSVTLTSAEGARASGRLALVKVAGTWKVDRLGVDFLRSVFAALPEEADTPEERHILDCLARAARGLSDRELRRVGNLVVGRRLTVQSFPPRATRCIRRGPAQTTTS